MAHIHRISGSTRYLLNGARPINGKKPVTLDELHHLYDHYEDILAETKDLITRRQDELIIGLSNDESRLDTQIKEEIIRHTREVDAQIEDLVIKTESSDSVLEELYFLMQYFIARGLRSYRIHHPSASAVRELHTIQYNKKKQIEKKISIISNECDNITRSFEFLKNNESFLIGADGEEYVIRNLSELPDAYHVINDVNLHFRKAIRWREENEYIKNCQIDHLVVGPTGLFLVETKNWKSSDIIKKSDKLTHQVRRSSLALWYYLKDYYRDPKIRNVIVSINSTPTYLKPDKYIDLVAPSQLCTYIVSRKSELPENDIIKLVGLLK
jgi:hypothetical protein